MEKDKMKFKVERFNGKGNFTLWKERVKDILVDRELMKALSPKPPEMKAADWMEIQEKAVSTIRQCLADEVMYNVMGEKTASGLWSKLESTYMTNNLYNKCFIKQQLYGLKLAEGGDIMAHISEFENLLVQLLNLEVKVEEEEKAILLLISLPKSYDHLMTTLTLGKKTISVDDVKTALYSTDKMRKGKEEKSQEEALTVMKGGRFRGKDKSEVVCYYCKKAGHLKRNCKKRLQDQEKRNEDSDQAGIAYSNGDLLSATKGKNSGDDWILDSGCSYHMCPDRTCFDSYKQVDCGTITMADNSACKAIGIGTVKIKMFDGVVRTVGGVRHVPGLRKNLISLGALDSRGCRYFANGGVLKVVKGNKAVIKGQKVGNLYKLIGSKVKVELGELDSQVDRDGSCVYACSQRKEVQEQVEPIMVGQVACFPSLDRVARS